MEYRNTVEDAFGMGFVVDLVLPADSTTHGLSAIAMSSITVSNLGVEQYETTGYQIARIISDIPTFREGLITCDREQSTDEACHAEFVRTYGERLWRRDLTEEKSPSSRPEAGRRLEDHVTTRTRASAAPRRASPTRGPLPGRRPNRRNCSPLPSPL
ncbi:MAG: DUF1587 domain-containing protein [Bradymonadaceae bacterium]